MQKFICGVLALGALLTYSTTASADDKPKGLLGTVVQVPRMPRQEMRIVVTGTSDTGVIGGPDLARTPSGGRKEVHANGLTNGGFTVTVPPGGTAKIESKSFTKTVP